MKWHLSTRDSRDTTSPAVLVCTLGCKRYHETQMGQALWRLPPRQQQQLQEELAGRLAGQRGGRREQDEGPHRRAPQHCYGPDIHQLLRARWGGKEQHGFIDLEMLPPELGITILSYLNATDLCLAGCVWQDLGNDEYLWQGLCKSTWGHCSIYNRRLPIGFSYRRLYLQLDEGSLTFNANPLEGISYFISKGILLDHPTELAKFIFYTRRLNWKMLRIYLDERRDVLDELVTLHNFSNQFLPNALRDFFRHIHAPEERGEYLETLITKFSHRFCTCNPGLVRDLGLSPEIFYRCCVCAVLQSDPAVHRLDQPPCQK
ncbi:F-box only protein 8 isoform X5 [Echeneis naucrates]|uniref:F-box only protein 8 isoform X5 n=1 Tax=Echeneis naucrates TaxID=173247 RepID=UPI0011141831|nr:F-box only protein 8 isoform X5 [Echeneis naucrates]